jgi:hypothetical protein
METRPSLAAISTESELDAEVWRFVAVFEAGGQPIEFRRQAELAVAEANSRPVGFVRSNRMRRGQVRAQVAVELVLGTPISEDPGYEPTPIQRRVIRQAVYWAAGWCLEKSSFGDHKNADRSQVDRVNAVLKTPSVFPGWHELVQVVERQLQRITGVAADEPSRTAAFWNRLRFYVDFLYRDYLGSRDSFESHDVLSPHGGRVPRSVADVCRARYSDDAHQSDDRDGFHVARRFEEVMREEVAVNVDISFLQRCGLLPSSPSWAYANSASDNDIGSIQRALSHQMYDRGDRKGGEGSGLGLSRMEFAGRVILAAIEVRRMIGDRNRATIQEIIGRISMLLELDRRTFAIQHLEELARQVIPPVDFPAHPGPSPSDDDWVKKVREAFRYEYQRMEQATTPEKRLQEQSLQADKVWDDVFNVVYAKLTGVSQPNSSAGLARLVCELIDSEAFQTFRAVQNWERTSDEKGSLRFWSDRYLNAVRGLAHPGALNKLYTPPWIGAVALIALGGPSLIGDFLSAVKSVIAGDSNLPSSDESQGAVWSEVRRLRQNRRMELTDRQSYEREDADRKSIGKIQQLQSWARAAGIADTNRRSCIITPTSIASPINDWSVPRSVFAVRDPASSEYFDRVADNAALELVMRRRADDLHWPSALKGEKPHFVEVPPARQAIPQGLEVRFTVAPDDVSLPGYIRRYGLHSITDADQLARKFDEGVIKQGVPVYWDRTFRDRIRNFFNNMRMIFGGVEKRKVSPGPGGKT